MALSRAQWQEIVKAEQLREMLGDTEAQLILNMIEGETETLEIADLFAELALADTAMIEHGRERLERLKKRCDGRREILRRIMEKLPEPYCRKLERPLYTASISYRTSATVTDQTLLPPEMWRHAPDMIKIQQALRAGEDVPGAQLGNPHPVLSIRKG